MDTDHLMASCPPPEAVRMPNLRERDHILNTAKVLISSDRNKNYGEAAVNFQRIADLWDTILDTKVSLEQVALCMIAVKIARLMETSNHHDSWVDICGYAALGGEIATA